MGIEAVFKQNPVEFEAGVSFNMQRKDVTGTAIEIAGRKVIEKGNDGLRDVSEQLDPINNGDSEMFAREMRRNGLRHAAVVALGASMIALEEALVTRVFDYDKFLDTVNTGFNRTLYPSFVNERPDLPISQNLDVGDDSQWKKMVALPGKGKYFSAFFMPEHEEALPTRMRSFLNVNGFLPKIREKIFQPTSTPVE